MQEIDISSRNNPNSVVYDWFHDFAHPLKEAMLLTRYAVPEGDERIAVSIKWKAPTFELKGNLVSFQPRGKKFISLMFDRGAEIPGDHPYLLGDAAPVRTMRLEDEADGVKHREGLQAVVRAWCDWKAGA